MRFGAFNCERPRGFETHRGVVLSHWKQPMVCTALTWWSVESVSQCSHEWYSLRNVVLVHFSSAHKRFWCYCRCAYRKGDNTESLCPHASGKLDTRTCHFSIWTDVQNLRGTIILYMVTVQYIYSLLIYLTATKACRLIGLPAATLNEELDPAYVSGDVFARVCVCVSGVCVCMSVSSWVCL